MEDYFGILGELIKIFEEVYDYYLYKKSAQPEIDIDNFTDVIDYDDEIKNILDILANLRILKNAPIYARLNKERWLEYLEAVGNGKDYYISINIPYKVKDYEDIQTIAAKFDINWQDILRINNLRSDEIEGGRVIYIPVLKKYNITEINLDIFGSQDKEMALGVDLNNYLDTDIYGDLKTA